MKRFYQAHFPGGSKYCGCLTALPLSASAAEAKSFRASVGVHCLQLGLPLRQQPRISSKLKSEADTILDNCKKHGHDRSYFAGPSIWRFLLSF